MVISIKNREELDQLIQQARNNQISGDTEIRLESNITIFKPIQGLSLKNGDKVRHMAPAWQSGEEPTLIGQINQSGKLFNDKGKFTDKEMLEDFKEYVNTDIYQFLDTRNRGTVKISEVNENDIITTSGRMIAEMFRKSEKIFGRNGDNCAYQDEDALYFLQSIVSVEFLQNFEYQAGNEFKLGDLEFEKSKAKEEKVEERTEEVYKTDIEIPTKK